MKIDTVAEHSLCFDLLPVEAKILDIGCLGFRFTDSLKGLGLQVFSVDIQLLDRKDYFYCGISDYVGWCLPLYTKNDLQATRLTKSAHGTPCWTLEQFSKNQGIKFWDLIKMDIEGSELQVIRILNAAPAKQLSIEFHLHTGIYTQKEMKEMETKLMDLGYEIVQHELTEQYGAGYNYWDSLFILP